MLLDYSEKQLNDDNDGDIQLSKSISEEENEAR
jgi:hypothetical protein